MKHSWNLRSSSILNLPNPIPAAPLSMKTTPDIRYRTAQNSWYAPMPNVDIDRPTVKTAVVRPVDMFSSRRRTITDSTRAHTADRSGDSTWSPVMK